MTTLREALEMALTEMANARDYIWLLNEGGTGVSENEMLERMAKTITALRAALAIQTVPSDCSDSHQRQPLTDGVMCDIAMKHGLMSVDWIEFARAIERAHGIGGEE